MTTTRRHAAVLTSLAAAAAMWVERNAAAGDDGCHPDDTAGAAGSTPDDDLTIGFVTHVVGNPFIQQIIDAAEFAAEDLGVAIEVTGPAGGDADAQLTAAQNVVSAGADGLAVSVPGESMANGLNEIIESGVPVVQFNLLSTSVDAPYVGERSVESGRILGGQVLEMLGGAEATGQVILGNCFPGFPVLENRAVGVQEALAEASRPGDPRPVRRHRRSRVELRGVGVVAGGEPRGRGPDRPVRPGPRQPRTATGGEPRLRLHRRRLRPHRGQPGGDRGRLRRRGDRPDAVHAGLSAGVHAGRRPAQRHGAGAVVRRRRHGDRRRPTASSSPSGCRR